MCTNLILVHQELMNVCAPAANLVWEFLEI